MPSHANRANHEDNLRNAIRTLAKSSRRLPGLADWIKASGAISWFGLKTRPQRLLTTRSLQALASVISERKAQFPPDTRVAMRSVLAYAAMIDSVGIRVDPGVPRDAWRQALVAVRAPLLRQHLLAQEPKNLGVKDLQELLALPTIDTNDRISDLHFAHRAASEQLRNDPRFVNVMLDAAIELIDTTEDPDLREFWANGALDTLRRVSGITLLTESARRIIVANDPHERAAQAEKIFAAFVDMIDKNERDGAEVSPEAREPQQLLIASCVKLVVTSSGWHPMLLQRLAALEKGGEPAFDDKQRTTLHLAALYGIHCHHHWERARGRGQLYGHIGEALDSAPDGEPPPRGAVPLDISAKELLEEVGSKTDAVHSAHLEQPDPAGLEMAAAESLEVLYKHLLIWRFAGQGRPLSIARGLAMGLIDDRWNSKIADIAIKSHAGLDDLDSVVSIAAKLREVASEHDVPKLCAETTAALFEAIRSKDAYMNEGLRKTMEVLFPETIASDVTSAPPHDAYITDAETRAKVMGVMFARAANAGDRESLRLVLEFACLDMEIGNEPVKAIGALCAVLLDDDAKMQVFIGLPTNGSRRSVAEIVTTELESAKTRVGHVSDFAATDPWTVASSLKYRGRTVAAALEDLIATTQSVRPIGQAHDSL